MKLTVISTSATTATLKWKERRRVKGMAEGQESGERAIVQIDWKPNTIRRTNRRWKDDALSSGIDDGRGGAGAADGILRAADGGALTCHRGRGYGNGNVVGGMHGRRGFRRFDHGSGLARGKNGEGRDKNEELFHGCVGVLMERAGLRRPPTLLNARTVPLLFKAICGFRPA
jgi:hypothetical protein